MLAPASRRYFWGRSGSASLTQEGSCLEQTCRSLVTSGASFWTRSVNRVQRPVVRQAFPSFFSGPSLSFGPCGIALSGKVSVSLCQVKLWC